MPNAYYYSSTAVQTTLSVPINAGAINFTVGSTVGWPGSYPYVIAVDYGAATEELMVVTANSLGTLTVTRGFDGTTAQSHGLNAVVRHVYCANDATAFRTHEAASSGVHGVVGNVVGTSDAQTLSNKTLAGPTINSGTLSGTFTGAPIYSGNVSFSGNPVFSGTPNFTGPSVTFSVTNGILENASSTTAAAWRVQAPSDTGDRFNIRGDGRLQWSPGNGTMDAALYRSAAGQLRFGNDLVIDGNVVSSGAGIRSLAVKGIASQTASLLQTSDSSGNSLLDQQINGRITLQTTGTTNIPLVLNAPTGQTASLQEWRVNSNAVATMDASGNLNANNITSASPWASFATTWTVTSGTNPVLGNGTMTLVYQRVGRIIHVRWFLSTGTTTTYGSSGVNYQWTLPVAAATNYRAVGTCGISAAGGARNMAAFAISDTTHFTLEVWGRNSDNSTTPTGFVDSNTPFAWSSGFSAGGNFFYEAASA